MTKHGFIYIFLITFLAFSPMSRLLIEEEDEKVCLADIDDDANESEEGKKSTDGEKEYIFGSIGSFSISFQYLNKKYFQKNAALLVHVPEMDTPPPKS